MLLKQFLPFAFIGFATTSLAQSDVGINFTKADSWKAVVAKAKAENKYIFLDGYTTWCGPCIMMAKKIFPLPEVGEFYNANFINVKVQLDTTDRDSDEVKKWYKDGNYLMTTYKINAFPTYLFFSPDGELVHRELGSSDADAFIAKGKNALNPDKQYYRLVREFDKGNREPAFLKKISYAAREGYDRENMAIYTNAYLATQQDLFTAENILFLADFTTSSKDAGFNLMMANPEKFDAIKNEPGFAANSVRAIIINEEVFPVIFPRDEKSDSEKEPDWAKLEDRLEKSYPGFGEQSVLQGKIFYYQRTGNLQAFSKSVSLMDKKYPNSLHSQMLNGFAWRIFEQCEDMDCVQQALAWSKKSLELNEDPMYMDTYANLLYKTGNTKEAIAWQKKAITLLKAQGEDIEDFEETLAKMEKGEKTWN
jgi:thiol-disulfide isomerase/thioredoxin